MDCMLFLKAVKNNTLSGILFYFLVCLSFSCNNINAISNDENSLAKDTSFIFLKQLTDDSSLSKFNYVISAVQNDSIKMNLIHLRRLMFTRFNSFQKLKISAEDILKDNPCYAPLILKMDRIFDKSYSWDDLFNESFSKSDYKSKRFIVGDFNTVDESGNCEGCSESFPNILELPELKYFLEACKKEKIDLINDNQIIEWLKNRSISDKKRMTYMFDIWRNLRDHVEAYRTNPLVKDSIIDVNGVKYCIGQRMCLCEIQGDTLVKVAQFVTSSKNSLTSQHNQHDFDGQPRYYAPMNRLSTRYWDSRIKYDSLDIKHDKEMGFGSQTTILYKGKVRLPNFMHITPDNAYPGAKGFVNGIHEFAVGGTGPAKYMGSPVSLGCVRLHNYTSKFTRWWTPHNAKMFIYYEDKRYKQNPIIKTIKN
jgi:hypothetical protein